MSEPTGSEARLPRLTLEEAHAVIARTGLPKQMAPLNVFRVLLHHPDLTKAVGGLLTMLLFTGTLDARLRELVIMRIGWVTGSVYEWTQHWRVARDLGINDADLLAVRDWHRSHLGKPERAVLAATDETLADGVISPATWHACEAHLGDTKVLLELVVAIGNWRLFSQLLRTLEIPLEDGMEPWPPDGRRPPDMRSDTG